MIPPGPGIPNSGELAGLWQQLNFPNQASLWVGTVGLRHLDVPVLVKSETDLSPLERCIVLAIALETEVSLARLDEHLGAGPLLVRRIAAHLVRRGLVEATSPDAWRISERGRQHLSGEPDSTLRFERRCLFFLDLPPNSPHFVALMGGGTDAQQTGVSRSVEIDFLRDSVLQGPAWKQRHRFPEDVVRVLAPTDNDPAAAWIPEWQRIVVDHPEVLRLALVLHGERLFGYRLHRDSWLIAPRHPVLTLEGMDAINEVLGEHLADPTPEMWQSAWKEWCSSQGIPLAEAAGIRFQKRGIVLNVTGHPMRPERLRALAMDSSHAEQWLVAGSGPLWSVARIEFSSPHSHRPAPHRRSHDPKSQ